MGQSQIVEGRQKEKQKEDLLSLNSDLAEFDKMPSFMSTDLLTRVAIDREKQRLYIWFAEDKDGKVLQKPYLGMPYRFLNFALKDLEGIAIVENASFFISHGKVDDILEGTKGSNSPTALDKVNFLSLLVKMDHEKHSLFQVNFYNKPYIPLAKDSPEYAAQLREARKCYDRLEVAMSQSKRTPESISQPLHDELISSHKVEVPIQTLEMQRRETAKPSEQVEREIKKEQPVSKQQVQEEPELSYFDRLVAENKRQLNERRSNEK
ncbi:hypothetical protein NSQ43_01470 [Sporosarcina sp. FSL W8-0480]|uniref:hypothetical protein n=1 Tax=Sporosarcina sp. FSL W8-0480 TaxID=2954701 RepID=UPI0030DB3018